MVPDHTASNKARLEPRIGSPQSHYVAIIIMLMLIIIIAGWVTRGHTRVGVAEGKKTVADKANSKCAASTLDGPRRALRMNGMRLAL